MNKILIISSRDLFSDGGEKNLLMNKDIAFNSFNWKTNYILIRGFIKKSFGESDFNIIGNFSLIQAFFNVKKINSIIVSTRPDVIVFSGLLSYFFFLLFKIKGYKTSLDYQGALEEIIEYNNKGKGLLAKLFYKIFFQLEKHIYHKVDIIEIVSENCKTHLINKYGISKAQFILIPCGIVENFSYENYQLLRTKWRRYFSIGENEKAAVFAGGVSKWQCVDDVVQFMKKFNGRSFFFTGKDNIADLKIKYSNTTNLEYYTLSPKELREALCAFDFGLLPREVDSTNFVAWPNKASEYYNARLTILIKNKYIGFFHTLNEACRIIEFDNVKKIEKIHYNYDSNKLDINIYVKYLISKYN